MVSCYEVLGGGVKRRTEDGDETFRGGCSDDGARWNQDGLGHYCSEALGGVVERDGIRKGSPKRGRVDAQGLFRQLPVEAEGGDESHQPSGEQPLSTGKIQNRHGVEFAGIYAHGAPDAMVGCNDAWNDKDKTIAPRQF